MMKMNGTTTKIKIKKKINIKLMTNFKIIMMIKTISKMFLNF